MSTPSSSEPAVAAEWVPWPLYRMSLEKYEAVAACGVFGRKDRLHLIDGLLVAKRPQDPPHSTQEVPVVIDGVEAGRVRVADILP